jgi:putative restriction endonuclease
MPARNQWLTCMANLNVNRSQGDPAPHKPLLLLSVLTRLDEGEALPESLTLTPELAFRFQTLWSVVAHRHTQRPDIRLPFHHLQSDGVWSALAADGTPSPHSRATRIARIEPAFAEFVADANNREDVKRVLIQTYFTPAEQVALCELVGLPAEAVAPLAGGGNPAEFEKVLRRGREARFRLLVVAAYNYTCALTGYRLTTVSGASVVDAAHIHRFADSRNNDPRNGLALCKNAHWMFDQGLWTVAENLEVEVAQEEFDESGPEGLLLLPYRGQRLHLPRDSATWPDPAHLDWHRRKVFAAG